MTIPLRIILTGCVAFLAAGCFTKGPSWLFKKKSPHEEYGDKLKTAGLHTSAMGKRWFTGAAESLESASGISIPFKETGYFAAGFVRAAAWEFEARRGEQLSITVDKRPENFVVFLNLYQDDKGENKQVAFLDTADSTISYEVRKEGTYRLRVQPELLQSGEYTLTITSGPSLAYPIRAPGRNHIQSFWGADRDKGARRHEGIDLFAPKRAPAVAAADGIVTRVTENNLGGKVIFMRPHGKDFSLYYAHLDEQLARDGQTVKSGDTIGLIGNTGNARNTPPHLHFGIYTSGGAIDPLPFVNPVVKDPPEITAPVKNLNTIMRSGSGTTRVLHSPNSGSTAILELPSQTVVQVESANGSWYRVRLPEENYGYLKSNQVLPAQTPISTISAYENQPVYEEPDTTAARKTFLPSGTSVNVLGRFGKFYYVKTETLSGWLVRD